MFFRSSLRFIGPKWQQWLVSQQWVDSKIKWCKSLCRFFILLVKIKLLKTYFSLVRERPDSVVRVLLPSPAALGSIQGVANFLEDTYMLFRQIIHVTALNNWQQLHYVNQTHRWFIYLKSSFEQCTKIYLVSFSTQDAYLHHVIEIQFLQRNS